MLSELWGAFLIRIRLENEADFDQLDSKTSWFIERNLLDEVSIFIPNGEILAAGMQVRIVLHMCKLPFFSTFSRAAELKGRSRN